MQSHILNNWIHWIDQLLFFLTLFSGHWLKESELSYFQIQTQSHNSSSHSVSTSIVSDNDVNSIEFDGALVTEIIASPLQLLTPITGAKGTAPKPQSNRVGCEYPDSSFDYCANRRRLDSYGAHLWNHYDIYGHEKDSKAQMSERNDFQTSSRNSFMVSALVAI